MGYLITALIIAFLVAVFAVTNNQPVNINFLVKEISDVPLSLVIIFSVLLGASVSALMLFLEHQKIKETDEDKIEDKKNEKKNI